MAPGKSAASWSFYGMACAYQPSVMLALACPRRVCTVFTSTPLASSCVACVRLNLWNFGPSKPCSLRHVHHQLSNVSMRYQVPVSEQHTGVFPVCSTPILASSAAWRSFHVARCDAVVASMARVRMPAWVLGVLISGDGYLRVQGASWWALLGVGC